MWQRNHLGNKITEILLPLCSYYLVNSIIITIGFTYLESKKEMIELTLSGVQALTLGQAVVRLAAFLCSALAVLPIYQKEKLFPTDYEKKNFNIKSVIFLFIAGGILAVLLNLLWGMIPIFWENEAYQRVAKSQHGYPLWLALPLYGILSPWAEEVLFRGVLFLRIRRHLGVVWAILLSSFLFGIFHQNAVQATYGMVMGGILAFVYHKWGCLKAPLLFHSGANIAVVLVQWLKFL